VRANVRIYNVGSLLWRKAAQSDRLGSQRCHPTKIGAVHHRNERGRGSDPYRGNQRGASEHDHYSADASSMSRTNCRLRNRDRTAHWRKAVEHICGVVFSLAQQGRERRAARTRGAMLHHFGLRGQIAQRSRCELGETLLAVHRASSM